MITVTVYDFATDITLEIEYPASLEAPERRCRVRAYSDPGYAKVAEFDLHSKEHFDSILDHVRSVLDAIRPQLQKPA